MHRQDQRRAQALDHPAHAVGPHGQTTIDRHHQHIQAADLGIMRVRQLMMQMAEMADTQPGNLEDEDGIAVFLKRLIISPAVADVG